MGKTDLLSSFLAASETEPVVISFRQVEMLLGHPLPLIARQNLDWWRGKVDGNEVAAALGDAGFDTNSITVIGENIEISRKSESKLSADASGDDRDSVCIHPLFGALKGNFTFSPDLDLTAPADPEWGKVYER